MSMRISLFRVFQEVFPYRFLLFLTPQNKHAVFAVKNILLSYTKTVILFLKNPSLLPQTQKIIKK